MTCPSCSGAVADGVLECPSCGIIVSKWRKRSETRVPRPTVERPVAASTASPRPLRIAAAAAIGAVVIIGGYWYFSIRPRARAIENPYFGNEPRRAKTLKQIDGRARGFDIAYELPGSPLGVATDGSEIIIGNRNDPWGAIRLQPSEKRRFSAQQVPIIEPRNHQRMNVSALTWNGKEYVGLTTGSWFGVDGDVFTLHDHSTLRITNWKAAPKFLGGLAWDGQSYWAATRRNTADAPEPALLYHIDSDFNVVSKTDSPGVGCQGLAWDGQRLWYADVFSNEIHVIDIAGETPRVIHKEETSLSYLSGIVAFKGDIWVTDYDHNLLQRIDPAVRVAWAGGIAPAPATTFVAAAAVPMSGDNVAVLQRQLRAPDWSERMRAEMELQKLGAPIDYDRDESHFVDRKADDTEVIDWSIELRDGAVYGSWKVWFGADVFNRGEQSGVVTLPQFARYTVTVHPPAGADIEKQFDAKSGENVMNDVRLADATDSGEYRVSMFLHVQYVAPDGQGKILNRSGSSLTVKK